MNFNPAARSFVRLDTWMWFDPAAVAAGLGDRVRRRQLGDRHRDARQGRRVRRAGRQHGGTGCAGGGRPYAAGGSTDCLINFSQSSGGQPGQQWHFQVSLNWNVTAIGAALQGPPTITRTENEALTVLEAQAVTATRGTN